jgi:hypothetical protein
MHLSSGHTRVGVGLLAILLGCSCKRGDAQPTKNSEKPNAETNADVALHMTSTDPKDPMAWQQALQEAQARATGPVSKHSDALPFLFKAEKPRAVLIHHNRIVAERGPKAAGAYLRDIGVPQGQGPGLDDVLWTLWALEALPKVEGYEEQGFINAPNVPRFKDLNPYIYFTGTTAQVVLCYLGPKLPPPPEVPLDARHNPNVVRGGGEAANTPPIDVYKFVRMTFDIPAQGDASWKREDLNWGDMSSATKASP